MAAFPSLDSGIIQVWSVDVDACAPERARLEAALSGPERERAARFLAERDRMNYGIVHGLLRETLGRYLQIQPAAVDFEFSKQGKPRVRGGDIHFNISHSGSRALMAFARAREVGVDIEWMRPDLDIDRLAASFFSRAEREELGALPAEERRKAFYHCWTCKEAYIKARGEGLALPLYDFDVAVRGAGAALVATRPDPHEARRWWLQALEIAEGYAAAAAAEGENLRVEVLEKN